jgi:hypothetical protein
MIWIVFGKALCELVFCTRKQLDSGGLVVCLGLGGVGIALVVSPLALVGRLLEVLPDLALVHLVDEGGLGLCDQDDLLDQASLDLLLNVVDPGEQISGGCRGCEGFRLTGRQKEEARAQCEESSRCLLGGLP